MSKLTKVSYDRWEVCIRNNNDITGYVRYCKTHFD